MESCVAVTGANLGTSSAINAPWFTAGDVIVFRHHQDLGRWLLLESSDPFRPDPLFLRDTPAVQKMISLLYPREQWGRNPMFLAPLDGDGNIEFIFVEFLHFMKVVPVLLAPCWISKSWKIVGQCSPDGLDYAQKRHIQWVPNGPMVRTAIGDYRALYGRLGRTARFIEERCLAQ